MQLTNPTIQWDSSKDKEELNKDKNLVALLTDEQKPQLRALIAGTDQQNTPL